jgi:hypothetical protein
MINNEFYENLKRNLTLVKGTTLDKLLKSDANYQSSCIDQGIAEKEYLDLDLSDYQRQIIDNFISITEVNDMEYSTLNYLAGLIDGHKIKDILETNPCTNSNISINPTSFNSTNTSVDSSYLTGFQQGIVFILKHQK